MKLMHKGYYCTYLENGNLEQSFFELSLNLEDIPFALVTCLDSYPHTCESIRNNPVIESIGPYITSVGMHFMIPTEKLVAVGPSVFFGFDELWLFKNEKIKPKPDVYITTPPKIDIGKIDQLAQWMDESECILGIGDGAGSNVVIKSEYYKRFIKQLTGE